MTICSGWARLNDRFWVFYRKLDGLFVMYTDWGGMFQSLKVALRSISQCNELYERVKEALKEHCLNICRLSYLQCENLKFSVSKWQLLFIFRFSVPHLTYCKQSYHAQNETIYGFEPGSEQRLALDAKLKQYNSELFDIPLVIGDEEIRTKNVQFQVKVWHFFYRFSEFFLNL